MILKASWDILDPCLDPGLDFVSDFSGFSKSFFMGPFQACWIRKRPIHRLPDAGENRTFRLSRLITYIYDVVIEPALLEELKDTVFGKCTNCRRCSLNCPMGVDHATFNRMARGLLVSVGVMPEGVATRMNRESW